MLALCLGLCACNSSDSSSSKKDKKTSSDSKDKDKKDKDSNDKKDSDDKSSALSDLFGGLTGDKDSGKSDDKDSKGSSNYSDGDSSYPEDGNSGDDDDGEPASKTDDSIDLSGLSGKQGIAYVYVLTSTGYKDYETGEWNYSDSDGYIHDGDMVMQRTLTVYREKNSSAIEYMLESAGEWGEYWHVEYDYPAKCTYFEYVEGGHVEISGNTAIWTDDYSGYSREIYTLSETRSYTN